MSRNNIAEYIKNAVKTTPKIVSLYKQEIKNSFNQEPFKFDQKAIDYLRLVRKTKIGKMFTVFLGFKIYDFYNNEDSLNNNHRNLVGKNSLYLFCLNDLVDNFIDNELKDQKVREDFINEVRLALVKGTYPGKIESRFQPIYVHAHIIYDTIISQRKSELVKKYDELIKNVLQINNNTDPIIALDNAKKIGGTCLEMLAITNEEITSQQDKESR